MDTIAQSEAAASGVVEALRYIVSMW